MGPPNDRPRRRLWDGLTRAFSRYLSRLELAGIVCGLRHVPNRTIANCCNEADTAKLMALLRAVVISCLMVAVPTTAVASAVKLGCKMRQQAAQAPSDHADHSKHAGHDMHAGHASERAAASDHSSNAKTALGSSDCTCGCKCSAHHCTPGSFGFLSAAPAGGLAFSAVDSRPLAASNQHLSSAHHLDLLRPPTWA